MLQYLALVVNGQQVALHDDEAQTLLDHIINDDLVKAKALIDQLQGLPPA